MGSETLADFPQSCAFLGLWGLFWFIRRDWVESMNVSSKVPKPVLGTATGISLIFILQKNIHAKDMLRIFNYTYTYIYNYNILMYILYCYI